MLTRTARQLLLFLALPLSAAPTAAADIAYVTQPPADALVVDARPLDRCAAASLAGARCLPADEIVGPHGRLANFRDILWFFGTAGLTGAEHVLVVGEGHQDRDFMAGVLFLAGQRQVSVLIVPPGRLADSPGTVRSTTRTAVYQKPMRDTLMLTTRELAGAPGVPLLDGRGDREYWGEHVRAARGGHIAGADNLPAAEVRAALANHAALPPLPADPVAYAHDPRESVAYFALLRAAGVAARVYVDGWKGWAADAALPVDALSFPDHAPAFVAPPPAPGPAPWPLILAGAAVVLLVGSGAAAVALRRRRWN